jgi:biopolymer transport protein ExbD
MALQVNGNGAGGGAWARRRAAATLSEINVTPFVDVVLVLLIIFMLTAHVMEFGIEVDVPKVRAVRESAVELPTVTVTKDGLTMLNGPGGDKPINLNDLPNTIVQRFGKPKGVYVRADKEAIWDALAQVVSTLGTAGMQVNMVTQPADTASQGRK